MMTYLADAAGAVTGSMSLRELLGWVTTFVVGVLGAVHLRNAKSAAKSEGKTEGIKEAQMIGPQPFIVQLREEFATRRELEKVEAAMSAHVSEMKASVLTTTTKMESLFRETMAAMATQTADTARTIERRHKATMEEIGKVASGAYTGRQKIWEVVNPLRVDLGVVKAGQDVAVQISKLADAIHPQTKVQPTHSSNS